MPASILMPVQSFLTSSSSISSTPTSSNQVESHFITAKDFEKWSQTHQSIRPSTVEVGQSYRPPQHPASHLLHSIPPRSAARSSRSNILSYTLHLSTSTRLETYRSNSGGAALLSKAERGGTVKKSDTEEWADAEEKSRGLRELSLNLLAASRAGAPLPPTVQRRVVLARLTEDLLVSPLPVPKPSASTLNPVSTTTSTAHLTVKPPRPSIEVSSLLALAPLTSPDTTTMYSPATSAARATSSTAQSLIELKFGNSKDAERESNLGAAATLVSSIHDNMSESLSSLAASNHFHESTTSTIPLHSVFSSSSNLPGASRGGIVEEPHMDYRIVRGQAMRSRAKEIFATSILSSTPSTTTTVRGARTREWCRRHRVNDCGVCSVRKKVVTESIPVVRKRVTSFPGQGLVGVMNGGRGRKPLAEIIPTFLIFSSTMLSDLQERSAAGPTSSSHSTSYDSSTPPSPVIPATSLAYSSPINVTPAWYTLLHSLAIQACLEGYLVDGWTGTEGIEVLFGCGCGVWEGKGWASRAALSSIASASATSRRLELRKVTRRAARVLLAKEATGNSSSSSDDEESEVEGSDEEAAARVERAREVEKKELVEAATLLFGSRDQAQAEFERNMRDRIHEFLNVPQGQTLHTHLLALNAKYPLSSFEDDVVDFLESTSKFLGKPSLARYDNPVLAPGQAATPDVTGASDPYALSRFFARPLDADDVGPTNLPTTATNSRVRELSNMGAGSGMREEKRRRMD